MLQFGVLGPVVVRRNEDPVNLRTAMLHRLMSVMLCSSMRPMSADSLVEAMWGEAAPATAKKTLQIYIHRLRRALGDDRRIVRHPTGYALTVLDGELDSHNFTDLVCRLSFE
ncbi:AfsR/SARP family transcriptional regulator [Allorhizocola rhizosphaerae]|uniref:AfsR/SARP family transcriptional regulator n=1 Tax=Allorhizocola rhizosphaerae TaxID=1872709 RepID=UPI000E3E8879|nr:winged helix-turn-helix domain-containing protein [Allorhizocola rhizosphaerae]